MYNDLEDMILVEQKFNYFAKKGFNPLAVYNDLNIFKEKYD